jgi:nitric oxide synthase oxygenase domain/subunit
MKDNVNHCGVTLAKAGDYMFVNNCITQIFIQSICILRRKKIFCNKSLFSKLYFFIDWNYNHGKISHMIPYMYVQAKVHGHLYIYLHGHPMQRF